MSAVPRFVVSAPSSGHGKNAVSIGLLAAFAADGLTVAGFKVGPDQTDAGYLGLAAGRPGRNLDPRLVGPERIAPLFAHGAAEAGLALVQGTLGLYDSVAGESETESTAAVATALRSPVVLVVDVAAMGQSVAALVHGFRAYDEMLWLGGVILNRVGSPRHEGLLREALDDIGVPVFGALRRRDLAAVLPARRHGLVPILHRDVEAVRGVRQLGEAVAVRVDLGRLLTLAKAAPPLTGTPWTPEPANGVTGGRRPVVALAGGPGGHYCYPETAELLRAAGAEVVTVDPLRDEALPAGTDALVIGGGLPESYAGELSANRRLCIAVAELARTGRPVIAEGAGLLWLARELDGRPMCGVLDAAGTSREGIVIGYRDATAQTESVLAAAGVVRSGYKQHSAVLTPRAGRNPAWSWAGGTPEGFVWRGVHASQLMLHWAGAPEIATRLVAAAGGRPAENGTDPAPIGRAPDTAPTGRTAGTEPADTAPTGRAPDAADDRGPGPARADAEPPTVRVRLAGMEPTSPGLPTQRIATTDRSGSAESTARIGSEEPTARFGSAESTARIGSEEPTARFGADESTRRFGAGPAQVAMPGSDPGREQGPA